MAVCNLTLAHATQELLVLFKLRCGRTVISNSPFGRILIYSIPSIYHLSDISSSTPSHPPTHQCITHRQNISSSSPSHPATHQYFTHRTSSSLSHPPTLQYFTYRTYLPLLCPIQRLISISPTGHLRLYPIHLLFSISPTEHIFAFSIPSYCSSVFHLQNISSLSLSRPPAHQYLTHRIYLRIFYPIHRLISSSPTGHVIIFSTPAKVFVRVAVDLREVLLIHG